MIKQYFLFYFQISTDYPICQPLKFINQQSVSKRVIPPDYWKKIPSVDKIISPKQKLIDLSTYGQINIQICKYFDNCKRKNTKIKHKKKSLKIIFVLKFNMCIQNTASKGIFGTYAAGSMSFRLCIQSDTDAVCYFRCIDLFIYF